MFNKKISSEFAIGIIIILSLIIGGIFYWQGKSASTRQKTDSSCTMEAKVCPDGSNVGRTEPNCEFAPCPINSNQGTGNSDQQTIVGGDKDEHGCISSAGYSWCEEKQKCLRTWEESCGE